MAPAVSLGEVGAGLLGGFHLSETFWTPERSQEQPRGHGMQAARRTGNGERFEMTCDTNISLNFSDLQVRFWAKHIVSWL